MSALAFPAPAIRVPARRRHLVAVPQSGRAAVPEVSTIPSIAPPEVPAGRAHPAAQSVRPAARARLRLTSRGRGVLAGLALIGATLAGAGVGIATAGESSMPAQTHQVTVLPGESLWTIASEAAEAGQDVRVVMDSIVTLNSLSSPTVHAGQQLAVPAD